MKPRAGFLKAQLNCEKLTPIQWDGIMRAMQNYAEYYHKEKINTKSATIIADFLVWKEINDISDEKLKKAFIEVSEVFDYRGEYMELAEKYLNEKQSKNDR